MFRRLSPGQVSNSPASHRPRAFTLIELMISIALVLLLILGVNQVFTYTTQAVGAGEAVNAAIRSSRAAQATFASDFAGIVPNGTGPNDSACMIISSRAYYSYRNAKDQAAEGTIDGSAPTSTLPTAAFLDLNGNGKFGETAVNGEVVYPATYNFRNHRVDIISFFARGLFPRQTGNVGTFVDNMSSQEAWIWYGHLHLPDNSGLQPGTTAYALTSFPCQGNATSNPNNYFGNQLVLGRVAMLLIYAPALTIYDSNGVSQQYVGLQVVKPSAIDPLQGSSKGYVASLPGSCCDLANTSIAHFKSNFTNPPTGYTATPTNWWNYMLDGDTAISYGGFGKTWYSRFECKPFVSKPMQSLDMAMASPYFLGGCSQYIVEFAGDFLTQDNDPTHTAVIGRTSHSEYGDVTGTGSDGQIDYVIVNGQKQIQWYGMPRGTSGNTTINWTNGDVVPVRDRLQNMYSATTGAALAVPFTTISNTNTIYPAFEKVGPKYQSADYGNGNMTLAEANAGYTCAFGPNDPAPKLIRITMTLEDPTGRLPEGQTYQYVFAVPQQ